MNVTISYEEMAEAFVCNHKYKNIFTQDIFNIGPPSQNIHK